jgi:O-antigen/teichoic acid export membrane protein
MSAERMQVKRGLKRTVFTNALANLLRLGASGIVALLLPSFLVRRLTVEAYSTWVLVLQVTVFASFLDFGVQTAVARFVAHAEELNDDEQRDGIASTAFVLLALAAALGLCVVSVLAWQLPHVFASMPVALHRQAKFAVLLMGGSFALGLPISVVQAAFTGQQRNGIPVAIAVLNKLATAVFVVLVVLRNLGMGAMGAAVAFANVVSYVASYVAWRIWAPQLKIRISLASKAWGKQIISYAAALGVWQVGMLMVSGLDLSIVGIFDYTASAYYAVAVTLTNFVVVTQNAIFAAVLPASAVLNARGDSQKLGSLLLSSTRYGLLILFAMALPLILGGKLILSAWVGNDYARHSLLIMRVLVVANVIRLSFLPYATLLLGMGEQRKVVMSPLAEGVANLIASIVGAALWGAVGVAVGTLIGSVVSVVVHLLHNMPRTPGVGVDRAALIKEGLFRPFVCAMPLILLLVSQLLSPRMPAPVSSLLVSIAVITTGYLLWTFGLISSERRKLSSVFNI